MTNVDILYESGHGEPWIIAMNYLPTRTTVLDYGSRRAIGSTFSDFKGDGPEREDSQLKHAYHMERLILIMASDALMCSHCSGQRFLYSTRPRLFQDSGF